MSAISPDRIPASVAGCLEACRRCETVVDSVIRIDGGRPGKAWNAVGAHLRHCVEHFQLLLRGLSAGNVDYDARPRDVRLESEPQRMRDALAEIRGALAVLSATDVVRPLSVAQSAAPGRPSQQSPSCLDRELVFLSGHTIHHIAIMVLSADAAGATIPARLAVAFSTEAHRESTLFSS